ncbi:MAG: TatD family nuclease-associated radical SAM protein [Endomicrobium sp.]|jgi:TatD DNase family protein|nr:TatD family nuclease-associated radical SAM protein [Endomicrobium sp.]
MNTISYVFGDNLYLNITNRCTMACPYCIKHKWANKFNGDNLKLEREPSVKEVIESIDDPKKYKEVIFCGYGDALIRIWEVKEIAKWIKERGGKVRINTAGLANAYHAKNILPELKGLVDVISVSLNGSNPEEHNKINNPMFKEKSFDEIVKFASEAKKYMPDVVITAVEFTGFDASKVKEVADKLGVRFRSRPYLDDER